MPFVRVDAERDVAFHVFDPADPARHFPGELVVGLPCCAHAQERGVCDGLCVGGYAVVFLAGEEDIFGAEGGEGVCDGAETFV